MALFNLQQPFKQKRGRIHHEDISKPNERSDIKFFGKTIPDVQKKSGHESSSTYKGITAEADDFTTRKVNDPKGVLNRPIRNREHKKGYKYKEEKDGSLTLKGRRGNPLNQGAPELNKILINKAPKTKAPDTTNQKTNAAESTGATSTRGGGDDENEKAEQRRVQQERIAASNWNVGPGFGNQYLNTIANSNK